MPTLLIDYVRVFSMDSERIILIVCVVLFSAVAAVWDWRFKKLPNKLTVPAFVLGMVFHLVLGAVQGGAEGAVRHLVWSLAGFAVGFFVLLVLWLVGGGGGGDVKFMGALGAWLGPELIFFVLIGSMVFVAFGSVAMLALESSRLGVEGVRRRYFGRSQKGAASRGKSTSEKSQEQAKRRRLLPYAVPVALATWTILAVLHLVNSAALSRLVGQG